MKHETWKDINLKKGMSKCEVNSLISQHLTLEDDVYLRVNYKHKWRCLCGNSFERTLNNIKIKNGNKCNKCLDKKEERYKYEVEKTGEYKYIGRIRQGDTLPNGNIHKGKPYLIIKHEYCNSEYMVNSGNFINKDINCGKCCGSYEKSFAYHIEVELGEKLEKYWDFEKNTVNPYLIFKSSPTTKVWIKCDNEEFNELNGFKKKDYHGSYELRCCDFVSGHRCTYCRNTHKVHKYDSFGYLYNEYAKCCVQDEDLMNVHVASNKKYNFICEECGHVWQVAISSITCHNAWCPQCNRSKGEKRIREYLTVENINYIHDETYFNNLLSPKGFPLRPDFILPNEKLWIEYDGEQHYKWIENWMSKDEFEYLKVCDEIKNKYAKTHGWELIRIKEKEFNNIEKILNKHLEEYLCQK